MILNAVCGAIYVPLHGPKTVGPCVKLILNGLNVICYILAASWKKILELALPMTRTAVHFTIHVDDWMNSRENGARAEK
jgi:hypothetical protein